jgi:succinyl-CoA synthetase beta subunit
LNTIIILSSCLGAIVTFDLLNYEVKMRLYENEAKKVFQIEGISVPKQYGVLSSKEDLEKIKDGLSFPVMMKSLVLIGGRGKAGGIQKVSSLDDALKTMSHMLGKKIRGYPVEALLMEEAVEEMGACYVGVTMNPENYQVVIIVSPSGGVDIEQVAREHPEAIFKLEIPDNDMSLHENHANILAEFLADGIEGSQEFIESLTQLLVRLYDTFQKYDCKVAEINPLIITPQGPVAADGKIVLDDNGLYRQGKLFQMLGLTKTRHDVSEPTKNELRARAAGFPYVDLLPEDFEKDPDKLYVGLVPGGAGYGIFSIDETANVGDRFFDGRVVPVNFMDSGGGPTLKRVAEMFHLLMDYALVDIIITSRFGGISSCDTFIRGLVTCIRDRKKAGQCVLPVFGRMVGTDLPNAREFLDKARRETPEELKDMHITVGNQTIMAEVIREGIQKAFEKKGWST